MRISVIIAHDAKRLDVDLKALKAEILEQEPNAQIIVETDGSISEARNKAVMNCSGDILVFLDDDLELRRNFMLEITEPFYLDEAVGIVGGVSMAPRVIKDKQEEISSVFMSSPLLWGKSSARYTPRGGIRRTDESELIGCCIAIRREAFEMAGGFPLDVIPCEENVLVNNILKLGWVAIYNPFAVVFHRRAEFPVGYLGKIFHYGSGRGLMMRRNLLRGSPRFLWKPSWMWIVYAVGGLLHFGFYLCGVCYGYLLKNRLRKHGKQK